MNEMLNDKELINDAALLLEQIKKTREELERRLENAPEGSLRTVKKHNKYQYYHRVEKGDTEGKYLPAGEKALAEALAIKDYDIKLLRALEDRQKAVERFLRDYDPEAAVRVYEDLTAARKQLVRPEILSDEEFIRQWQNEPYEKLGFGKDEPEYYTARGERVRSKSEILIADSLYRHNIPYRYEYPVYSHGVLIAAPDFNCLNVRLRKEYYWEHLGMMGREEYADRNVKKIEKYTLADDFDAARLILTLETDKKPVNTKVVEEQIRRFLL